VEGRSDVFSLIGSSSNVINHRFTDKSKGTIMISYSKRGSGHSHHDILRVFPADREYSQSLGMRRSHPSRPTLTSRPKSHQRQPIPEHRPLLLWCTPQCSHGPLFSSKSGSHRPRHQHWLRSSKSRSWDPQIAPIHHAIQSPEN
jgi:hypothetical protein